MTKSLSVSLSDFKKTQKPPGLSSGRGRTGAE
uniref:Uncharacterized protein n=1 Tax=Anguilla anguilla TaxID=7936 RepID=A0A0E9PSJ5_ANGAN